MRDVKYNKAFVAQRNILVPGVAFNCWAATYQSFEINKENRETAPCYRQNHRLRLNPLN